MKLTTKKSKTMKQEDEKLRYCQADLKSHQTMAPMAYYDSPAIKLNIELSIKYPLKRNKSCGL